MSRANLAFDQAPPLLIPLRFFLTAPLFGMAASAFLLWQGPAILASRWSPGLLALTHLLTLGVLVMVMIGALSQMLPVVAGMPLLRQRGVIALVHPLLIAGTGALAIAFLTGRGTLFVLAAGLLVSAFVLFLISVGVSLARAASNDTVRTLRLAVVALTVTVILGTVLAIRLSGIGAFPVTSWVDVHLAWGLAGWVALLIMGAAYQVVPMLLQTAAYPGPARRWLAPLVILALAILTVSPWLGIGALRVGWLLIGAGCLLFAVVTLRLLLRGRRRGDVTVHFWILGLASLLTGLLTWAPVLASPLTGQWRLMGAALWIVGFGGSVIQGMLYKITPFLVWLHLHQNRERISTPIPHIQQILAPPRAHWQFGAHVLGLALMLSGLALFPPLVYASAAVFLVSFLLLEHNLIGAYRIYHRCMSNVC